MPASQVYKTVTAGCTAGKGRKIMCGIAGFIAGHGAANAAALCWRASPTAGRTVRERLWRARGARPPSGHHRLRGRRPCTVRIKLSRRFQRRNLQLSRTDHRADRWATPLPPAPTPRCCCTGGSSGRELLPRLRGMFAFALWDRRAQVLFCARDMFGIKPLYYCRCADGTLLFASEIKAF